MLQIHRWFIIVGIVFIVFICLSVNFRLDSLDSVFMEWKQEFLQKAKQQGVSETTLQSFDLLVNAPDKSVFSKDEKKKDKLYSEVGSKTSVGKEVDLYLNDNLILKAQLYYRDNLQNLEKYASQYAVDSSVIVAMLAIGSEFGDKLYQYRLANVLATKSVIGDDKSFYEKELLSLLKLVDLGYVELSVKGDKDGTFTYLGINPSAYLYYGIDSNKKGKVDLFFNKDDIYESSFYLLNQLSFIYDVPLGYQVNATKNIMNFQGIKYQRSIKNWLAFGVKNINKLEVPKEYLPSMASFIALDNNSGILLMDNFNKILKINNNVSKSIAITILSNNLAIYGKQMAFKKLVFNQDLSSSTNKSISKKTKLDDLPVEHRLQKFINVK